MYLNYIQIEKNKNANTVFKKWAKALNRYFIKY